MIDIVISVCCAIVFVGCFVELHAMNRSAPIGYMVGFAIAGCSSLVLTVNHWVPVEMSVMPEKLWCGLSLGLALIAVSCRKSPWRAVWESAKKWDGRERREGFMRVVESDFMKGDGR